MEKSIMLKNGDHLILTEDGIIYEDRLVGMMLKTIRSHRKKLVNPAMKESVSK